MSQINQFIKQVENYGQQSKEMHEKLQQVLHREWSEVQVFPPEIEVWRKELTKFRDELVQMKEENSKKLSEKLNQVDPVSGTKRYGAQTQQKFLTADQQLTDIIDQFLPLYEHMEAVLSRAQETIAERKAQLERIKLQQELEDKELEQKRLQSEREAAEQLQKQRQQEENEKAESLRIQAEAIRRKKQEEFDALSSVNQQVKGKKVTIHFSSDLVMQL